MYVGMYVYIYIYAAGYCQNTLLVMHINMCMYACVQECMYVCVCMCVGMYVCVGAMHMQVCSKYVCIYVFVYASHDNQL